MTSRTGVGVDGGFVKWEGLDKKRGKWDEEGNGGAFGEGESPVSLDGLLDNPVRDSASFGIFLRGSNHPIPAR